VVLPLGGSNPADLALGAGLRQEWGYDEINLQGLSPKENREVPPLRHDLADRLKRYLNGNWAGARPGPSR
jgi:hypothetical protein